MIYFPVDGEPTQERHGRTKTSVEYAFYILTVQRGNPGKGKNFISGAEVNDENQLSKVV